MALWISVLLAGTCLGILSWVFLMPGSRGAGAHPKAGQAIWLRLCWPWIDTLAQLCRPFLVWRWRSALTHRMAQAGLAQTWLPEHFAAAQLWLALGAGLGTGLLCWQANVTLAVMLGIALAVGGVAGAWPLLWLSGRQRGHRRILQRELPFFLDLLTLCVEAGQSLQGALQQAIGSSPEGPLTRELTHVLAQLRTGVARADAFDALAERSGLPALRQLAFTLRQAEQFGMSLGPILRAQSTQQRDERFLRAEKLALEAPVQMLFPLVFCIFPCTFLIIGFPLAASFLRLA